MLLYYYSWKLFLSKMSRGHQKERGANNFFMPFSLSLVLNHTITVLNVTIVLFSFQVVVSSRFVQNQQPLKLETLFTIRVSCPGWVPFIPFGSFVPSLSLFFTPWSAQHSLGDHLLVMMITTARKYPFFPLLAIHKYCLMKDSKMNVLRTDRPVIKCVYKDRPRIRERREKS